MGDDALAKLALSIRKSALVLGVSRSTVYTLLRDHRIVGTKIGARTVIAVDELRRFLREAPKLREKHEKHSDATTVQSKEVDKDAQECS